MAALKEGLSYGLSCGRVSDGSKVSVFHVKLTDSALRAFESYSASQVSSANLGPPSGTSECRPTSCAPRLAFRPTGAGSGVGVLLAYFWACGERGTTFIIGAGWRHWRATRGSNSRVWSGRRLCDTWWRLGPFPARSAPGQELVCSPGRGRRVVGALGFSTSAPGRVGQPSTADGVPVGCCSFCVWWGGSL